MTRRVVIAGASGFIGRFLISAYTAEGSEVSTIGRSNSSASWGDPEGLVAVLDGADLVINLAGKSVNCRYNVRNRAEILRSRVQTTREISEAIGACASPPPVWMNSSTATIYRHAEDRAMTESTGELGTGFSVGIATAWERELFARDLPGTRRVALRMAIVLGDGSALTPLLRLARFGLGGAQLDGRWPTTRRRRAAGTFHEYRPTHGNQKFSWVHIADVLEAIRFIESTPSLEGPINISSPNPSNSRTLMATIRRVLGVPFGLPMPRWMLEIGSFAIRTETELVLKSRWVTPERLEDAGFAFNYAELEPAVREIVAARTRTRA